MSHGPVARAAIAVVKQRESVDRRLFAVSLDDARGQAVVLFVAAELGKMGWVCPSRGRQ